MNTITHIDDFNLAIDQSAFARKVKHGDRKRCLPTSMKARIDGV